MLNYYILCSATVSNCCHSGLLVPDVWVSGIFPEGFQTRFACWNDTRKKSNLNSAHPAVSAAGFFTLGIHLIKNSKFNIQNYFL